ncbi:Rab-GTPase-TBC domain [Carpediemonas membranifera]|uniref:Rab-GTPase-TBC domain n=1 Tax=Carpediemonas membranifera TaxID=201153 RepID=A0A8J6E0A3_9EUKA|nr:Rab-GTPase-TBC domain [Carpediemonas membranifera]|eukprot:KAG9391913.1 Rab-GTPase-TBC domain [Carpediemonas membranifera]
MEAPDSPRQENVAQLDRYGFIVNTDASGPVRLPTRQAIEKEHSRVVKWTWMLRPSNWCTFHHTPKFRQRVRKGIPEQFRGAVWQKLLQSTVLYQHHELGNKSSYDALLTKTNEEARSTIARDIERTFPSHAMFRASEGRAGEAVGRDALERNLNAFACYKPEVGYCQGMGFISGVLLMYMSEKEAFWALRQIVIDRMPGIFDAGFPKLQVRFKQWNKLLSKREPAIFKALARHSIDASFYTTQWFMTLFIYAAPFEVAVRIFDCFCCEGVIIVFRVGLAYMRSLKKSILKAPFEEVMMTIQHVPLTLEIFEAALELKLKAEEYALPESENWGR